MPTAPDFARLFDALPSPHMVLDRQLRYVAANRAYLEVTGATLDALLGTYVIETFPNDPDDPNDASAQMLRRSLERVVATGEPDYLALIPYRVFDPATGGLTEERFWSATHQPVLGPDGAVAYLIQQTNDVTELHRERTREQGATRESMESWVLSRAGEVQREKTRLERELGEVIGLLDQAPGFLCYLRGPELVFELANEAYRRLVGRDDVLGKPIREALPEIEGQGFFELLEGILEGGEPYVGIGVPVDLRAGDDDALQRVYVDFIYQPVRGPSGAVEGVLVQGADMTERHQAAMESEAARRAAEAMASELQAQSEEVQRALEEATARIHELEEQLKAR